MSDRDALLAAIRAQPDEDTPRLIFADWLQENDQNARAEFIRAQVELARTPGWEPFAVRCRRHRRDVLTGEAFLTELPRANRDHVGWSEYQPFRRGFGWAIDVRAVALWAELAEPLFGLEPIGKITFWTATLDDWRRIAASPCLRQFRELVFTANPIEPLWALRDRPAACGITDISFNRASGAGMPEVIEDLFRSPLGGAVRGLHFRTGYESLNELMDALNTGGPLERLSFTGMGLTADHLRRLLNGPATSALTTLNLHGEPIGSEGLRALAQGLPPALSRLWIASAGLQADGLEALTRSDRLASLRCLGLHANSITPRCARILSLSRPLAGLRSLDASSCRIGDRALRHITQAKFWPNLVELDLYYNEISSAGVRYLLDAPVPPDLTALVLDAELGSECRAALVKKYGQAAVFVPRALPA